MLPIAFAGFALLSSALPVAISFLVAPLYKPTKQDAQLVKAFSMLVLGVALATLATLNFSLALIIGVLAAPLSFVGLSNRAALKWASAAVLTVIAPTTVIYSAAQAYGLAVGQILTEASFGWNVWGMYTPVAIWGIWWPAWTIGMVSVLGFGSDS
jgi:glycosylphosphatidylinositol transamidase